MRQERHWDASQHSCKFWYWNSLVKVLFINSPDFYLTMCHTLGKQLWMKQILFLLLWSLFLYCRSRKTIRMLAALCSSYYDHINNYHKTEWLKTITDFIVCINLTFARDWGSAMFRRWNHLKAHSFTCLMLKDGCQLKLFWNCWLEGLYAASQYGQGFLSPRKEKEKERNR